MDIDTRYRSKIFKVLHQLSAIPSLTGKEETLALQLPHIFRPHNQDVIYHYNKQNQMQSVLYLNKNYAAGDVLYVAHLDRVPSRMGRAYVDTIKPYVWKKGAFASCVQGQLDDIIGMSILHVIHEARSVNILFTTREEVGESWPQIEQVVSRYHFRPVGVDIDIFNELPASGLITLRDHDGAGSMHNDAVLSHRQQADALSIPWTGTEGRSITEIGYVQTQTKGRVSGVHVGLPLIHYHTNKEIMRWDTILNATRLLLAMR
jgi:putative aminopeptidase FrvX